MRVARFAMGSVTAAAVGLAVVVSGWGCSPKAARTTVIATTQPLPPIPSNAARARGGMVATVNPLATEAGLMALRRGGNAIDAAVAAALTLGVVDSHNSGIGGGCFMLIHTADGRTFALDGREMAPAAATRDMFLRNGRGDTELSQTGPLASGVPGALATYELAIQLAGKGKLADALFPAADLAEQGYPVDEKFVSRTRALLPKIRQFPGTARVLLKPDGTPRRAGDILHQYDLAATYRAIATEGTSYFYGGPFAQKVERWMKANGGILTAADFVNYQVRQREPLISTYRGYTLVGFPPPSSGGVHVAQILNILERFDLSSMDEARRIHVTAEAMKLAFADRGYWLGDPDFAKVPVGLVSKDYAETLASKIDPDKVTPVTGHGTPPNADTDVFGEYGKHTTHIATADAEGNWVALTQTVNTTYGSKVIVPGTGVVLNNEMDDFSVQPGVPNHFGLVGNENNAIAPGKRPLSSMSPTFVLKGGVDGQPMLSVGAAGGPRIITQVLLVLSNLIDGGQDLPTAMSHPRFHHQGSPDKLWIENTASPEVLEALRAMGHTLDLVDPVGATQAIGRSDEGIFIGVAEPRIKDAKAAGIPDYRPTSRPAPPNPPMRDTGGGLKTKPAYEPPPGSQAHKSPW